MVIRRKHTAQTSSALLARSKSQIRPAMKPIPALRPKIDSRITSWLNSYSLLFFIETQSTVQISGVTFTMSRLKDLLLASNRPKRFSFAASG
jgi:hypothetical protein